MQQCQLLQVSPMSLLLGLRAWHHSQGAAGSRVLHEPGQGLCFSPVGCHAAYANTAYLPLLSQVSPEESLWRLAGDLPIPWSPACVSSPKNQGTTWKNIL